MPLRIQRCQPYHRGSKPGEVTTPCCGPSVVTVAFAAIATPSIDSSHTRRDPQSGHGPPPQPPSPHEASWQVGWADVMHSAQPWGASRRLGPWHVSAVSSSGVIKGSTASVLSLGDSAPKLPAGPGPGRAQAAGGHKPSPVATQFPGCREQCGSV